MQTEITKQLLKHYQKHKRDLPWRKTQDPYAILVSEFMLQQTQVATVIPYFNQFMKRYPTLKKLARASDNEICAAWAGLGYYHRAKNLRRAAARIVQEYHGQIPWASDALQKLPGVGAYTAGAIASIAFNQSVPVVDGNVKRVLSRLYALDETDNARARETQVWNRARSLVPKTNAGEFNQALMELGATLCTRNNPQCKKCPIRKFCQAYISEQPEAYPRPSVKVNKKCMPMAVAWLQDRYGIWLQRRPVKGLWPGLWELPCEIGLNGQANLEKKLGFALKLHSQKIKHELTHRKIVARVYLPLTMPSKWRYLEPDAKKVRRPENQAITVLTRKVVKQMRHALATSRLVQTQ